MNETLAREILKYEHAYRDPHYSTNQGLELLRNFSGLIPAGIKSIVDIGCGDGRFVQHFADRGIDAWGIDFVDVLAPGVDRNNFVRSSFYGNTDGVDSFRSTSCFLTRNGGNRFEFATCLDVMEHIPEEFVDETLGNICPLADTTLFEIANYPSGFNNDFGPLHLTLHDADWWTRKLGEFGVVMLLPYHRPGVEEYLFYFRPKE